VDFFAKEEGDRDRPQPDIYNHVCHTLNLRDPFSQGHWHEAKRMCKSNNFAAIVPETFPV
jgi:hypothetical protein